MSEIKELFANTFPDVNPSVAGRSRVAEMALAADRKAQQARVTGGRLRLGFGVGLATLAVGAGIILTPSITTAAYIRHLGTLVKDARSAHIVEWKPTADGGRTRVQELWYDGGKWRIDAAMFGTVTIATSTKKWVYTPARKSVAVSSQVGSFVPGNGFTVNSMLENQPRGSRIQITDAGAFKTVSMENPIDNSIFTMWVDKRTDYPVKGVIESLTPEGRKTALAFQCEFNRPVSSQQFVAEFPKGTKVVDTVGGEKFWTGELAKSLATFEVKGMAETSKLVIRNVQVTELGDVFLLYSGKVNQDGITVSDDLGTVYVRCDGFQAQGYRMDQETSKITLDKGIQVDGQKLDGGWWTPLSKPGKQWTPRKLKFSISMTWYKTDPEKMKRLPKTAMVKLSDMTPVTSPIGEWSVKLSGPTCGLTPDYMPYMGMGPQSPFDVERQDDDARVKYLMAKERFAEVEPILRDVIRQIEHQEATTGQTWVKSSFFFDLYRSLKEQGKHAEAKTWLAKVQSEPGGAHGDVAIEQALRLEGL